MLGEAWKSLSWQANKLSFVAQSFVAWLPFGTAPVRAVFAYATREYLRPMLRLITSGRHYTDARLLGAALWSASERLEPRHRALSPAQQLIEPVRLGLEDHWQRAVATIAAAIASFRRVEALQAAAARQIDAA